MSSKKCPTCNKWLVGNKCGKCGVAGAVPAPINASGDAPVRASQPVVSVSPGLNTPNATRASDQRRLSTGMLADKSGSQRREQYINSSSSEPPKAAGVEDAKDANLSRSSYNRIMAAADDIRRSVDSSRSSGTQDLIEDVSLEGLELEIKKQINLVRDEPITFASNMDKARRERYEDGMLIIDFEGEPAYLKTKEGPAALDNALAQLNDSSSVQQLVFLKGLCKAATDARRFNKKSPNAVKLLSKYGSASGAVRQISWRGKVSTADEMIYTLITDDGSSDRQRRQILLDDKIKYAGVTCGVEGDDHYLVLVMVENWRDGERRNSGAF